MPPAPRAARAGCRRTDQRRRRARRHAVGRGRRRRCRSRFRCRPSGYGAAPPSRAPLPARLGSMRSAFGLFGFTSRAITPAWGTSSESSSSRLGISSTARMLTPVRLPPGRARLATRPAPTGSAPMTKTIGIVEVALFAASAEGDAARRDHVDLAADEIGGQCGQPIIVALRPAVFDRHVLSLDIAGFAQSLVERGHIRCSRAGRAGAEEADHRHRLLLRAQGARRRHRAAQQEHQLAAPHSMTSSARARIDCGTVRPSALAVLRLTTSSNVVGCSTGRSAGLAPLRIFPT